MTGPGNIEMRPKSLIGAPGTYPTGDGGRPLSWPSLPAWLPVAAVWQCASVSATTGPLSHGYNVLLCVRSGEQRTWSSRKENSDLTGPLDAPIFTADCKLSIKNPRCQQTPMFWAAPQPLCFTPAPQERRHPEASGEATVRAEHGSFLQTLPSATGSAQAAGDQKVLEARSAQSTWPSAHPHARGWEESSERHPRDQAFPAGRASPAPRPPATCQE